MMLTQLANVARRTGYPVVEVAGWKTRGHGGMSSVQTITCHHTANGGARGDAPSLGVVRSGRPGLSGPLAHFVLGRSGTIYVVAAGLCYHAGVSRDNSFTNSHAIGIEAEAKGVPGTAGDWPLRQMDAYARLCKALIHEYNLSVGDVLGHKETCAPHGRKSDPSFSMPTFRNRIAHLGNASASQREENEMTPAEWNKLEALLDKKIKAGVIAVLTKELIVPNKPTAAELAVNPNTPVHGKWSIAGVLANIETDQDNA